MSEATQVVTSEVKVPVIPPNVSQVSAEEAGVKIAEAPATPGSKIKALRLREKLSQRELGLTLNATTQFISNLERNVTPVPFEHVRALAHTLKTEPGEIALYALESSRAYKLFLAIINNQD